MRIYKTKLFNRWAKRECLNNTSLEAAVNEMEKGLYDANLGGSVYKKRLSIGNRGKRGGGRSVVAFKLHDKAIFIYGFSKNQKENITAVEEEALKKLAKIYFEYNDEEINRAIKHGELIEV